MLAHAWTKKAAKRLTAQFVLLTARIKRNA
jgi:hypothetical protein